MPEKGPINAKRKNEDITRTIAYTIGPKRVAAIAEPIDAFPPVTAFAAIQTGIDTIIQRIIRPSRKSRMVNRLISEGKIWMNEENKSNSTYLFSRIFNMSFA